jgi:PAS domain S-box-containing protein
VRLATAIEAAAEAVVVTDLDSVIHYVNPAFEMMSGYRAGAALGRSIDILRSNEHPPAFYDDLSAAVRRGEVCTAQLVLRRQDGVHYHVRATIAPVRDPDGALDGFVQMHEDITHEIELQRQLLASQKMEAIGRLASGLAHDFHNLLAVILNGAWLLLDEMAADDPLREEAEEIRHTAQRGGEVVRQLLTLGPRSLSQAEVVDLGELVAEARPLLARALGDGVELRVEADPGLRPVSIDPVQMEQLLLNLATNAHDAMPDGGRFTIGLDTVELQRPEAQGVSLGAGTYVRVIVSDTGSGMPAEVLAHAFEPFYTTKGLKGTGLGLATVYGQVQQAGGQINVRSAPGEGTTFTIYLPAAGQAGATGEALITRGA